jgi:hypothetical protein
MNICEEVKKLHLPLGEYVVVGSGPLAVRGIRNFNDIALLVSEQAYSRLSARGWEETIGFGGRMRLKLGLYEAYQDLCYGDYRPDTKILIEQADIVNGIPFLQLEELIRFKKAVGREKDLADIRLIEAYLARSEGHPPFGSSLQA